MGEWKGTIVLDFDGVLNSYASGWTGEADLPDPPTEGAVEFVHALLSWGYEVTVASTRCSTEEGRHAVAAYLIRFGFPVVNVARGGKPPAMAYVDDRALRFNGPGTWPTEAEMAEACVPWTKRTA